MVGREIERLIDRETGYQYVELGIKQSVLFNMGHSRPLLVVLFTSHNSKVN